MTYKVAAEHFEMAARAFTQTGKPIDPEVCEKFADILARESAGYSAVVKELNDIKMTAFRALIPGFKKGDSSDSLQRGVQVSVG